ncbi:trafficking kinesin-binding protein 1-like isoform X2 [Anguilla anguilla]|nr:trafficking kinesin-binding protein 1-like isoform X2 [Anguilla anguilla]XP_035287338.1 trafficking kinesin-binding protein 1-like isoform X2 [Anguilla anguilla]XP_035287339.1 trafficking kinesin-binding protein 1-like isoform X2 [Anguilla anguilla]
MTKTYNDIDAVTRLLEEKERDLELAARIGQSLLKKNRTLTEQNEFLEERVGIVRDEIAQLRHELSMKDELLQFYTSTAEESEGESASSTPLRRNKSMSSVPNYFPMDSLQRKLKDLEEENIVLRSEACHLKTETISYEEKEHQLVNDCVKELRQSTLQISSIAEELARKTEDAARQQEEITHLLSQIVDLQKKAKSYSVENEELSQHLAAAKDAQRQLTAELLELGEKYAECVEMLHEAQEECKNLRNRVFPNSTPRRVHPLGLFPLDSLAAEIEGTMRKEMQLNDPEMEEQKTHHKRVFETVKNINQTVMLRSPASSTANIPGSNQPSSLNSGTPPSSWYAGDLSSVGIGNRSSGVILESPDSSMDDSNKNPGAQSSRDLELALRRLSLRRENFLSERRFFERDRGRKLRELSESGGGRSGALTPIESIMSLGTHPSGLVGYSLVSRSYLPDKLQIVKPLEGSATLHQWQQLAQPNLGGILDSRPGVVPKGFRPLELDLEEVYQFSDFEEDEPGELFFQNLPTSGPVPPLCRSRASSCSSSSSSINNNNHPVAHEPPAPYYPGKCMSHTSSTYTFTTCRILHPSDELTRVTPSLNAGLTSSCIMSSSRRSTPAATPCTPRRLSLAESFTNLRDSTKTTSTSLGLVRLLQERGISAAVYHPQSWDRAGSGAPPRPCPAPRAPDAPPSTPPNSPTGPVPAAAARADADAPFDFRAPSPPYDNFLASKPARSILREVAAESRGRADCESQTDVSVFNLNLVDKVRRFGVAGPAPALGPLSQLNAGMRRNRTYPAMVGASMAMKDPGPESGELILDSKLPKQTSLK